jgi:lipid II:glycine glycyltransferase (peptidoglycan interpeptide bridge formation enzyme)
VAIVRTVDAVDCYTKKAGFANPAGRCVMIDVNETQKKLREEQLILESLIERSIEQSKDINDARIALRELESKMETADT